MKNMKRRLMSVVLALVLVCSMIPTGMMAWGGTSLTMAPGSSKSVTADNIKTIAYWDAYWYTDSPYVQVYGASEGGITQGNLPDNPGSGWFPDDSPLVSPTGTIYVDPNAPAGTRATVSVTVMVSNFPYQSSKETASWDVYVTGGATGNYVQISSSSLNMNVGDAGRDLRVTPISLYGARITSVSWTSSNPSVASVSDDWWNSTSATVTAVSSGKATITAYVQGTVNYNQSFTDTLTCTVTVNGGNVSLSRTALDLTTSPQDLTVYVNNGYLPSNYSARWESSREDVATVSNSFSGTTTVTPKSNGTTIVTAKVYDVTGNLVGSASCTVTVNGGKVTLSETTLRLTTSPKSLTVYVNGLTLPSNYSVDWTSGNTSIATVTKWSADTATVTPKSSGTTTVKAVVYDGLNKIGEASCTVTVNNGRVTLSDTKLQLGADPKNLTVLVDGLTTIPTGYTVTWTSSPLGIVDISDSNYWYNKGTVTLYPKTAGKTTVTATVYNGNTFVGSASCEVTVGMDITASATVTTSEKNFTLGSTNQKTTTSVVNQIASAVAGTSFPQRTLSYVVFSNVTSAYGNLNASVNTRYSYSSASYYNTLSAVTFTPSATSTGVATFSFTAYDTNGNAYNGTLRITVEKGSTGIDILYSATVGQTVQVNPQDFASFWTKNVSSVGTLRYVTFGNISGTVGQMYYTNGAQKYTVGNQQFYYSPSFNQNALSSVYFAPSSSIGNYRTGTLVVPFTAYGTSNNYNSTLTSASGTMYICVTNGEVQDVTYQASGTTGVTLNPADFQKVYQTATGSIQSNPTMYIQFLDVPTYGSLYYNYKNGIFGGNGTKLTAANIGTMVFSSGITSSYGINGVTYIPGTTNQTETIRYVAFSTNGGTPVYMGEIVFNATAKAPIKYHTNSSGVTFSASDFFNMNTGLLSAQYITFGRPTSGTLYKNYSNGKGTAVTTSDRFYYYSSTSGASVNSVTYVPLAGYTGVVTIPYTGYTTTGAQISGNIKVYVVAKNFTDVPSTDWSYPYVTELAASGVVGGITPTTYGAKQQVKWGEALKMVLLAAGYPKQAEGTGANWAANYLSYAYRNNLVSSNNIDLDSSITRLEMAELAAKALKLSPASRIDAGIVGPTDTTNGYVYALYNAGIVGGDSSSGKNRYNPNSTLLRDEMAKIVCGVMDNAQ